MITDDKIMQIECLDFKKINQSFGESKIRRLIVANYNHNVQFVWSTLKVRIM